MFDKKKVEKPKEFQLTNIDISELSFYDQNIETFKQIFYMWSQKKEIFKKTIVEKLAIAELDIDWNQVYRTGKIFAHKPPPSPIVHQEETKKEVKGENDSNKG